MDVRNRREAVLPVRPHRVVALAVPAVVAFDLSVPAQVFGHRDEQGRYSFAVSTARPGRVPTSTGFAVEVEHGLEALAQADTVVVPGFSPLDRLDDETRTALQRAHGRGARIVSICVGAFALAMAGLLDGRPATTHWGWAEEFRQRFPAVRLDPDVLFVDDGDVLTSAGISAGIDLCLHLVALDHGAEVAAEVAGRMVVAARRTGGQLQFATRRRTDPGGLGPTLDWALTCLDRPLGIAELARHAGLPVRTFTRRFREEVDQSPAEWLVVQRVREAQRLLESTRLGVDEVALRSGLGSATTLRAQLRRHLGTTPTAYRRSFVGAGGGAGSGPAAREANS